MVFHSKRLAVLRGVFVRGPAGLRCCSARVQVSLVQEIIGRTTFPCTSLADMADYPPDSGRLEQKTPSRDVFWCTSETCTSLHRPCRSDSPRRNRQRTPPRWCPDGPYHPPAASRLPPRDPCEAFPPCHLPFFKSLYLRGLQNERRQGVSYSEPLATDVYTSV